AVTSANRENEGPRGGSEQPASGWSLGGPQAPRMSSHVRAATANASYRSHSRSASVRPCYNAGVRMTWTRRQFLELGATSLAVCTLEQCGRPAPEPKPKQDAKAVSAFPSPRYVVILYLDGGIDPILTINPKTKDQVAGEVDAPNEPGEIVEAGAIRLGAHF